MGKEVELNCWPGLISCCSNWWLNCWELKPFALLAFIDGRLPGGLDGKCSGTLGRFDGARMKPFGRPFWILLLTPNWPPGNWLGSRLFTRFGGWPFSRLPFSSSIFRLFGLFSRCGGSTWLFSICWLLPGDRFTFMWLASSCSRPGNMSSTIGLPFWRFSSSTGPLRGLAFSSSELLPAGAFGVDRILGRFAGGAVDWLDNVDAEGLNRTSKWVSRLFFALSSGDESIGFDVENCILSSLREKCGLVVIGEAAASLSPFKRRPVRSLVNGL